MDPFYIVWLLLGMMVALVLWSASRPPAATPCTPCDWCRQCPIRMGQLTDPGPPAE